MIVVNNYYEAPNTDDSKESYEKWMETYYPSMLDSSIRSNVSQETSDSNEIKELRSEISKLAEQVSMLVTLLSSKEVIQ